MYTILLTVFLLVFPSVALSQPKPVGSFSPNNSPSWMSFGTIDGDDTDSNIINAVARSRNTGFRWLVQMGYHDHPLTSSIGVADRVMDRMDRLGLTPFIVGISYGEEWYERCLNNEFVKLGYYGDNCYTNVYNWLSIQHQHVANRARNIPIVWITGLVDQNRRVPSHVTYVALDYYPNDHQTLESLLPVFHTSHLYSPNHKKIIIARWYYTTGAIQGDHWPLMSKPPTQEFFTTYRLLLDHPDVVAMLGFLWESRPFAHLVGLQDMPAQRLMLERSLGIAP